MTASPEAGGDPLGRAALPARRALRRAALAAALALAAFAALGVAGWAAGWSAAPDAAAWLMQSIDAGRPHRIDAARAWHARIMVVAWAVMIPLGVLTARFFKITPRQRWPEALDSQWWWRAHLVLQIGGVALTMLAVLLVWPGAGTATTEGLARLHRVSAWTVCALAAVQVLGGMLRGSKGGPLPGGRSERGDHDDMTPRRVAFEYVHKGAGYAALVAAVAAMASGLLYVNAPRWMPLLIGAWWLAWLAAFAWLQRRGWCIDTYQAIWGADPRHPGNRRPPIGPGVRRRGDA